MAPPDSKPPWQSGESWPPADSDFPALVPIAEHQLLACIGRGSYGQVWLARNSMGAYRAVKIVFRHSFDNDRPFERELAGIRKFEPISRLHEGLVDILQVGINEERGYFYYIMELGDDQVSGQSINPAAYTPNTLASEISRRGYLSLQECLQLGLALTNALAELHKHGLVHRDIKPSNIVFVDGLAKLADIGLVTGIDEARSYVGTEGFIPPEGPINPQADLYSLGKVLYEASTGKDRQDFPELPVEWEHSPEYRGLLELNEIVLQACQPSIKDRYASAWDMHADLLVVVNGKSVKRLRVLERRMATLKRGAGIVALLLTVIGIVGYQVYREWRRAASEHERRVNANVNYGNRAMEAGDLFGALPYFADALRLDEGNPSAEAKHRLRLGSLLAQCPRITQMWFHDKSVTDAEFSPDGRNLLLSDYFSQAGIYDLQSGKLYEHGFGPQYGLRCAVYSPDGRFILTCSEADSAILWDATTLSQVLSLPHTNRVESGRFSPDGRRIVTACADGFARVWDAATGKLQFELPPNRDMVAFAAFSHDGRLLVTASHDQTARIWHAADGSPATPPLLHTMWVNWADFSPDDKQLVTASDDHRVRVWDVGTGTRILPDMRHNDVVESARFSPDGRLIATACFDGTVRLWRAEDHEPALPVPILRHSDRVNQVSFSPDGRLLAAGCADGSVRLWDLAGAAVPPTASHGILSQDGRRFLADDGPNLQLYDAASGAAAGPPFAPCLRLERKQLTFDGSFAVTESLVEKQPGRTNRLAQGWNTVTGRPLGPALEAAGAALSANGQYLALYTGASVQIVSAATGAAVSPRFNHSPSVTAAIFSPDGSELATLGGTNTAVWDTRTGLLKFAPLAHPVPVSCAQFSRDGKWLVTGCSDPNLTKCSAQVWDAQTGKPVGSPLTHSDGVICASFSPDATRIITGGEDFTAKIWDAAAGLQIGLPLRHSGTVAAAGFSPNGKWVATASLDRTARVWDPQTGDPLTPPFQHDANVRGLVFLADGSRLATWSGLRDTFFWALPVDPRPAPELRELTDFLLGGDFVSPVSPSQQNREPLAARWQRLRTKFPADFTVATAQVVRWHEYQVEESEREQNWLAAALHLKRLLQLKPGDAACSERLAHAEQELTSH